MPKKPYYDVDGPSAGCKKPYAVCLRADDARKMLIYLQQLEDYTYKAWTQCVEWPENARPN